MAFLGISISGTEYILSMFSKGKSITTETVNRSSELKNSAVKYKYVFLYSCRSHDGHCCRMHVKSVTNLSLFSC